MGQAVYQDCTRKAIVLRSHFEQKRSIPRMRGPIQNTTAKAQSTSLAGEGGGHRTRSYGKQPCDATSRLLAACLWSEVRSAVRSGRDMPPVLLGKCRTGMSRKAHVDYYRHIDTSIHFASSLLLQRESQYRLFPTCLICIQISTNSSADRALDRQGLFARNRPWKSPISFRLRCRTPLAQLLLPSTKIILF